MNKRKIGTIGEDIAINFLEKYGVIIIKRNYFTKFGEIDLIGFENKTIIFIEVKLRNNMSYGLPIEGISSKKIERLRKTADLFLSGSDLIYDDCRFDVIGINLCSRNLYRVEWLKSQYFD